MNFDVITVTLLLYFQEYQTKYNREKAPVIAEKQQIRRKKARDNRTQEDRFRYFCQATIDGPTFVCFSCKRALFKKGVKVMKDNEISKLFDGIHGIPFG